MPSFDGTGPRGMGPMTGRGMGSCGRGLRGRGRGYGRCISRWGWNRPVSKEDETVYLEEEKGLIEKELEEINKRLKELEK